MCADRWSESSLVSPFKAALCAVSVFSAGLTGCAGEVGRSPAEQGIVPPVTTTTDPATAGDGNGVPDPMVVGMPGDTTQPGPPDAV